MPLRMDEFGCWQQKARGNIYYPNNKKETAYYEVCSICKGILIKIKLKGTKGPAQLICSLCGVPAQKPAAKKTKKKSKKRKS